MRQRGQDIVDRNGEVDGPYDVKEPSLFGEPRRILDKDEGLELLTANAAGSRHRRSRESL